jgi:hypothetical protein
MKFQGKPNEHVVVFHPKINEPKNIKFDANGVFETHNKTLAIRMKKKYPVVGEAPQVELKKCKKCDFTCENQGELMRHYKIEHPKVEGN